MASLLEELLTRGRRKKNMQTRQSWSGEGRPPELEGGSILTRDYNRRIQQENIARQNMYDNWLLQQQSAKAAVGRADDARQRQIEQSRENIKKELELKARQMNPPQQIIGSNTPPSRRSTMMEDLDFDDFVELTRLQRESAAARSAVANAEVNEQTTQSRIEQSRLYVKQLDNRLEDSDMDLKLKKAFYDRLYSNLAITEDPNSSDLEIKNAHEDIVRLWQEYRGRSMGGGSTAYPDHRDPPGGGPVSVTGAGGEQLYFDTPGPSDTTKNLDPPGK